MPFAPKTNRTGPKWTTAGGRWGCGTDSCQARHVGFVQAGTLRVIHNDGSEAELGAGNAYVIEPGHDAHVVGDEQFIAYEFEPRAAEEYARG